MNKIVEFVKDCQAELGKVVWPDHQERMNATWVVVVSVMILTAFLYVVDLIFAKGANSILH